MNLERKYKLIERIIQNNDDEVLNEVYKILEKGSQGISVAQYNAELDKAESQIKNGDCQSQEEVEKESEKW
jgi:hypothetical protein